MSWGRGFGGNPDEQPQTNAEFYTFNTLFKLRDAESEKKYDEAFVFMRHALQMLMAYLSMAEKKVVDAGIREFDEKLSEIELLESEASKKKFRDELKKKFIEQHMYYVYLSLPRARMIKVDSDGELPIDKVDLRVMSKLIKTHKSTLRNAKDLGLEVKQDDKEPEIEEEDVQGADDGPE